MIKSGLQRFRGCGVVFRNGTVISHQQINQFQFNQKHANTKVIPRVERGEENNYDVENKLRIHPNKVIIYNKENLEKKQKQISFLKNQAKKKIKSHYGGYDYYVRPKVNETFVKQQITIFAEKRRVKPSVRIFDLMVENRSIPSIYTYRLLLNCIGFRCKVLAKAHEIFNYAKKFHQPDIYCYNIMIHSCYAVGGQFGRAQKYFNEIIKNKKLKPNSFSFNYMLKALHSSIEKNEAVEEGNTEENKTNKEEVTKEEDDKVIDVFEEDENPISEYYNYKHYAKKTKPPKIEKYIEMEKKRKQYLSRNEAQSHLNHLVNVISKHDPILLSNPHVENILKKFKEDGFEIGIPSNEELSIDL